MPVFFTKIHKKQAVKTIPTYLKVFLIRFIKTRWPSYFKMKKLKQNKGVHRFRT